MSITQGSVSVYLLPGMKAQIVAPGSWISDKPRSILLENGEYEEKALKNGFVVQNEDIGTIEPGDTPNSVIYTHKKFALNKIFFFARTGEMAEVHVIAVPVHDHSSIVTGGPAYGTYFTDDETVEGD